MNLPLAVFFFWRVDVLITNEIALGCDLIEIILVKLQSSAPMGIHKGGLTEWTL